jgi:hypothetical protein
VRGFSFARGAEAEMRRVIPLILAIVYAEANAQESQKLDVGRIASDLRSAERDQRFAALKLVEASAEVPVSLIDPLVQFVRREAEYSLVPPEDRSGGHAVKSIVLTGEEVSLVRLKGNPQDYIGKEFILCGGVAISDYYNYGFSKAASTHYSYRFYQVDKDVKVASNELVHVYLAKSLGKAFSEKVTQVMEGGANAMLIRLRCYVDPERIGSNHDEILSHIEIRDWQSADDSGGWNPWAFSGIFRGYAQIRRIGLPAVPALTDIILSDQVYQNEGADELLRAGAAVALLGIDPESRRSAQALLQKGVQKVITRKARDWAVMVYGKLAAKGETTGPRPQPKPIDRSVRAATTLRSAQNLEKAKKIPGALGLYRQIVKDYPETPEAKVAAERIKTLGGQ